MADKVDPRTGEVVTANYGWVKPTVGASVDAWGGYINADLDGIDSTVHGIQTSIPAASSTTPAMDGTAAIGTGTTWARADHVHASDTSRLPLSGGTLTGALTPSQTAGIVGTTTNNNAAVGAVGEYVEANQTTNVSMATATTVNITSISLTAGDWDVSANIYLALSAFAGTGWLAAVSLNSAGPPSGTVAGYAQMNYAGGFSVIIAPTGTQRVLIAATTTVYLVAQCSFSSGTCNGQGTLRARRVR